MQGRRGADEKVAGHQQERRRRDPGQYDSDQAQGHKYPAQADEEPAPQARYSGHGHIVLGRLLPLVARGNRRFAGSGGHVCGKTTLHCEPQ